MDQQEDRARQGVSTDQRTQGSQNPKITKVTSKTHGFRAKHIKNKNNDDIKRMFFICKILTFGKISVKILEKKYI